MKKTNLIILGLIIASLSQAFAQSAEMKKPAANKGPEVLECFFTEPFFNLFYDARTHYVMYKDSSSYKSSTGELLLNVLDTNARLVPVGVKDPKNFFPRPGTKYELQDETGDAIISLRLDYNGSDGMSDNVFPFTAIYNSQYGGCETTSLPQLNPTPLFELLKTD